jgi:hypothetical protein
MSRQDVKKNFTPRRKDAKEGGDELPDTAGPIDFWTDTEAPAFGSLATFPQRNSFPISIFASWRLGVRFFVHLGVRLAPV